MAASLAIAGRAARRGVWLRPEWPWVALAVGAWAGLVAAAGMSEHAPGLAMWTLMTVAMMVPATIPVLRAIALNSMWDRRYRSPALFLLAYVGVWVALGAAAIAAWRLAGLRGTSHALHGAAATAAILVIGANWQLSPRHRRCVKRCHRALPLGARGRSADRACLRYGLFHGRQCAGACWPLMLAMHPGHGLALMIALTALSSWQRLARRPRRDVSAGVLLALAAVVLLVD